MTAIGRSSAESGSRRGELLAKPGPGRQVPQCAHDAAAGRAGIHDRAESQGRALSPVCGGASSTAPSSSRRHSRRMNPKRARGFPFQNLNLVERFKRLSSGISLQHENDTRAEGLLERHLPSPEVVLPMRIMLDSDESGSLRHGLGSPAIDFCGGEPSANGAPASSLSRSSTSIAIRASSPASAWP